MSDFWASTDFAQKLVLGLLVLAGVVITAIASVKVARIAAASNRKGTGDANVLGWAKQMQERVTSLEGEVAAMKERQTLQDRVVTAATGYIDAVLWWFKTGQRGRMPRPPEIIRDHLDPNLLELDPPLHHDDAPMEAT